MAVYHAADFEAQGCDHPGCTDPHAMQEELFIHASCHPRSPTWARYVRASRTLEITCAQCKRPVVTVAVG